MFGKETKYFDEGAVEALNVVAKAVVSRCVLPLEDRLKQRLIKNSKLYQFGFTGFKGFQECSSCGKSVWEFDHWRCKQIDHVLSTRMPREKGLVGQILVAIEVPEKPEQYAYWYVNIPGGSPAPYEKGGFFTIDGKLSSTDISEDELQKLLQDGINRLSTMLRASY